MTEGTNRKVVQTSVGDPRTAIEVVETAIPVPGPGELLIELVIAPINPAEVLMLEGNYGFRDSKPGVPRNAGIEGVGRVIGGATDVVAEGSLVSLAGSPAVFSDYHVMPAGSVVVLDDSMDPDLFSVGFVNAQSVLLMLHEWNELQSGDWIIQNAGNSAYGRMLDLLATRRGFNVINVVRSESAAAYIRDTARGSVVIGDADAEALNARVLEVTGGVRPKVAVDAIGGAPAGALAFTLAAGGRIVTYGFLSGEDVQIDTRLILFNDIHAEGFWMPRSMQRLSGDEAIKIRDEVLDVLRDTEVSVPIQARFSLSDAAAAVELAAQGGRAGKVVLTR